MLAVRLPEGAPVNRYAELQVTSHFSFLRGASSARELFATAAELGITALGIVDRHSLAGIVQAHQAAAASGVRLVVGCRLDLDDGTAVLVYPTDRPAYARLCRLLTLGKARGGKGRCRLAWADLVEHGEGLLAVLVPDLPDQDCALRLARLRAAFADRAYLALTLRRRPGDALRLHGLAELAARASVPVVATNDVLYHVPERRILQDVVTCIRLGCTIDDAGFRRERHADRHLKSPDEMARLFRNHPDAIARSLEIVERCRFRLDQLAYQYPHEVTVPGRTAQAALALRVEEGKAWRYPHGVPAKVVATVAHELRLIEELGYAPYFLTVDAIVRFARSEKILCQGRGSAANSAVCYLLGITSIDPAHHDLLFERFVSKARDEPPDIDVDFEHERREEVIQWIYRTYGHHRAALCATVIRYRAKGALREVGKVMGLSEDVTAALAGQVWGWSEQVLTDQEARQLELNLADRRLRLTLELVQELTGVPRHLSQHPGGFVLTQDRLDELVPIEPAAMADRRVIEWNKDDIDALKFMKVDVLGLGMLGCMRRAFDLLAAHKGLRLDLAGIPHGDAATYAMIRKADTIGVFQIESRAQMSMLPRMKPRVFYDLVIEVAIVRPGPIQGDMVHPYLRRREGREAPIYPTEALKRVLGKTLGVPLFQEQAMCIAIECAGFSPAEADELRRAMASFNVKGDIARFRGQLIAGLTDNGYPPELAERLFDQLKGFSSYGFPESHATSFAQIAYASSWMKCHHPDVFCAALLNAQPMGFYAPAQIVRDALEHEVEIRAVDVETSGWDCTLEPTELGFAVRLGLRMVKGLAERHAERIVQHRPFAGIEDLWRRTRLSTAALARIAEADGFLAAYGLARREALWAIGALRDDPLPLFATGPELVEPAVTLAPMPTGGEVVEDYATTGLTLRQHPLAFLRAELQASGYHPCGQLATTADSERIMVAGLVLLRQRPGSAKGVLFVTIEDETGLANLVVWPDTFERHRRLLLSARMLGVTARLQRAGAVIHLVVEHLTGLDGLLRSVGRRDRIAGQEAGAKDDRPGAGIKVPIRSFR